MSKILGRNSPCPCGSGRKYKHCHLRADVGGTTVSVPTAEPEPTRTDSLVTRANALLERGDLEGARASCLQAVRLDPCCAPAHMTLGNVFASGGHPQEALESFRTALRHDPTCRYVRANIGSALYQLGRHSEALAAYQDALRFEPDNAMARHMVLSLSGAVDDTSGQLNYVKELFDSYATRFDRDLVQDLNYRTPQVIAGLVNEIRAWAPSSCDVLDLGCGTGLCGAAVRTFARRLVGVDISSKMLEVAARRGIYTDLRCEDLITSLAKAVTADFDLVLAADVFIYVGRLDEVMHEVRRVLRPGGVFAFSAEQLEARQESSVGDMPSEYALNATGRYAHSADYLHRLAQAVGFEIDRHTVEVARIDFSRPITGWVEIWRAPLRGA
jgi:predicted TPR repeat methyltransferase